MGIMTFNGIASTRYNIQVEHPPEYEYPERDYETVHVPGRNGDISIDKGSYKNVPRKYQIAVGSLTKDYTPMANGISEWLHSGSGYARLEDSYEQEYYRLAKYEESNAIENILRHAGRTTISFDCKPQRFFIFGDTPVIFASMDNLRNPTRFIALPIITVNGSGSGVLRVGDYTVTIETIESPITINSEIQDAYITSSYTLTDGTIQYNQTNANELITLSNGFPKLVSGNNEISFSGGITSVEVIPKWWTL